MTKRLVSKPCGKTRKHKPRTLTVTLTTRQAHAFIGAASGVVFDNCGVYRREFTDAIFAVYAKVCDADKQSAIAGAS